MIDNFRYWLSSHLIDWSIKVLPDDYTKSMVTYGMTVATAQMLADLEEQEEGAVERHTIH